MTSHAIPSETLSYAHIILCILTIGIVGFVLDRLMSMVEAQFKTA
jgi:nitrate/nitrite transport system permease protein